MGATLASLTALNNVTYHVVTFVAEQLIVSDLPEHVVHPPDSFAIEHAETATMTPPTVIWPVTDARRTALWRQVTVRLQRMIAN